MARKALHEAEPTFPSSLPRARGVQRKLGRDHLAFLRGALEGLPLQTLSRRYLPLDDPRHAEERFQSLCASSEAAVRAAGRPSLARLFRVFPQIATAEAPDAPPSLEAFRDRYDPDGVLAEVDLIAAYQDAHGPPQDQRVDDDEHRAQRTAARRRERAARLRQRQREALAWLERRIVQDPEAGDPVAAWFADAIVRRLHVGGIYTLHQLAERIDGVGRGWWRGVPGIGPASGARLQRWVGEHAETLRVRLGAHTTVPRRQLDVHALVAAKPRVTAIVPLERFRVPADLDGAHGRFRAPPGECLLSAANDFEAILAWLASKSSATGAVAAGEGRAARLPHTQRAYRKEAERFLLWAILERKRPLSSMTVEDRELRVERARLLPLADRPVGLPAGKEKRPEEEVGRGVLRVRLHRPPQDDARLGTVRKDVPGGLARGESEVLPARAAHLLGAVAPVVRDERVVLR